MENSKNRHGGIFEKLWILYIFRWFLWIFSALDYVYIYIIAWFLGVLCIFLSKENSYKYNSGRFRNLQTRATTLVFSIFRLFPFMARWKSSHIQEKPVANCISVKFYSFCYLYNFWGPWEFITYSNQLLPHTAHHKSSLKQEKPTFGCIFINIYCFYNFEGPWEFFRSSGPPYPNLAEYTTTCAPVKCDYFGQFCVFEGLWEFLAHLAQPFPRYLITISAGLAVQRSVGIFVGWQLGHGCLCFVFKFRHMPGDAGNSTGQLHLILGLGKAWCKCLLLEIGLGQLPSSLGSYRCGYMNLFGQLPIYYAWY